MLMQYNVSHREREQIQILGPGEEEWKNISLDEEKSRLVWKKGRMLIFLFLDSAYRYIFSNICLAHSSIF